MVLFRVLHITAAQKFSNNFSASKQESAPWPRVSRLGGSDALKLALTTKVRLEFSEHPEHVKETFACRSAGVDWLLRGLQRGTLRSQGPHNFLQVPNASREAINAGHYEYVPLRRKSRTVRNSSRPCVVVPDRFSERIVVQPSRGQQPGCPSPGPW
jgi:hypothetical protein